ncbi:MAG TPA: TRAP transporter small permease subunit, partial [Tianweitania sediminis]|nr:TRAP transporter small permease subunit [Tianweitania sediminis]
MAATLLALLLALVSASVVLRYGFATAIMGSDELAIWLHVALVGVGAPLVASGALGMRLDFVTTRLPRLGRSIADVLAQAIIILSGLVLLLGGAEIINTLGGVSPALGMPEWVRFFFLCAGGCLILLVVALRHLAEGRVWALICALLLAATLYFGSRAAFTTPLPPSAIAGLFAAVGLCAGAPLPHLFLASAFLAIPFGATLPEPAIVSTAAGSISKFLLLAI